MTYLDLVQNAVILGLLAAMIAKINEATIGRVYDALYALIGVSDAWQSRINSTRFLWAVILGVLLCVRSRIPFMGDILPAPDSYVVAGLVVGSGAGLIWDLVLDKVPGRDAQ